MVSTGRLARPWPHPTWVAVGRPALGLTTAPNGSRTSLGARCAHCGPLRGWRAGGWPGGGRSPKTPPFLDPKEHNSGTGFCENQHPSPRRQSCVHAINWWLPALHRGLRQRRHLDRNFEQEGASGARRFLSGAFISQNRRRAFMGSWASIGSSFRRSGGVAVVSPS